MHSTLSRGWFKSMYMGVGTYFNHEIPRISVYQLQKSVNVLFTIELNYTFDQYQVMIRTTTVKATIFQLSLGQLIYLWE